MYFRTEEHFVLSEAKLLHNILGLSDVEKSTWESYRTLEGVTVIILLLAQRANVLFC